MRAQEHKAPTFADMVEAFEWSKALANRIEEECGIILENNEICEHCEADVCPVRCRQTTAARAQ